jgi:glutaredoxin
MLDCMRISLVRVLLLVVLALVVCVSGCSHTMATHELDGLHNFCNARAPEAKTIRRSPDIGVRPQRAAAGTPVVIYGAAWCGPCHAAASYLTRQNIPYIARDIEEDDSARRDMDAAVAAAGLQSEMVLPIVDVRGTVMKGFMPCVIEDAWAEPE